MADIMTVMDAAKGIMRQSGNMHQWGDGYPSEVVITTDMEKNGGFVVEDEGKVVGYFAFLPSPEPTYASIFTISGTSLNDDHSHFNVINRSFGTSCSSSLNHFDHVKTFFDFTEYSILAVKMRSTTY